MHYSDILLCYQADPEIKSAENIYYDGTSFNNNKIVFRGITSSDEREREDQRRSFPDAIGTNQILHLSTDVKSGHRQNFQTKKT